VRNISEKSVEEVSDVGQGYIKEYLGKKTHKAQ